MAADIHALEIEFAKNPTLDACLPLCEAYMAAKRYMEAMVVCKKGIKNAPADVRGRIMLARVYVEQGKLPKAEQEMVQVLAEFPGVGAPLEMMGRILMLQGKKPEATGHLQQALQADPQLVAARTWLGELGAGVAAAPSPAAAATPLRAAPAASLARPAAPGKAAMAGPPPARAAGAPPPAAQAPVGAAPRAAPPVPAAEAFEPAAGPARPLEHVGDFFAPDALGFANEASSIETAGPGRLTILGFVPKSTGSLRTTILALLGAFAVGTAVIAYTVVDSKNQRQKNDIVHKIRLALDDDRYNRYKEVLVLGEKVLKFDSTDRLTLSAMAYAEAVLALDHREPGSLEKAEQFAERAAKADDKENEFGVAARAIIAFVKKDYDKGLADVKAIQDKGGSSPLLELEAFRLMDTLHPDDKDAKIQMRRLVQSVTSQARPLAYLGWYYYKQEDWGKAGKFFDQTLQNAKGHPMALIGRSLVGLDQGIGLEQKQKDIDKDLKEVFALPPDELSAPTLALAYFARAQLLRWQNNVAKADEDFEQATKRDPDNMLFAYRRGLSLLKLGAAKEAVEQLRKVAGSDPNNPKLLKKLAEAQTQAQLYSDAKASLDKAQQLSPAAGAFEISLLRGALAMAQDDSRGAIEQYETIKREDGGEPFTQAQIAISQALRLSGDKAKAAKHMEAFLEKIPDGTSAEMQSRLWCELGQAYEATKNKAKAVQTYQVGIEQYRFYADCHFFLCRVLVKGPEAKEACKTYLTLDPRGRYVAEAQKHLR